MGELEKFTKAVKDYELTHLNRKKPKFKFSDLYDLELDWKSNSKYPFAKKTGIYAIFDKDEELLYIGKASNQSSIGARLSTYFENDEEGKCHPVDSKESWGGNPRIIISVSVNEPFEAPSLEEFLISELQPKSNSVGRN